MTRTPITLQRLERVFAHEACIERDAAFERNGKAKSDVDEARSIHHPRDLLRQAGTKRLWLAGPVSTLLSSCSLSLLVLFAAACPGSIYGGNSDGGDGADTDANSDTGSSTVRRLSVRELGNSLEALTGVRPASLSRMPPDADDYTFGRVVNSQTVSRVHMEAMEAVADELTATLIDQRRLSALATECRDDIMPPSLNSEHKRYAAVSLAAEPAWAVCQQGSPADSCGSDPLEPDAIYFLYAPEPSVSLQHTTAGPGIYAVELVVEPEQSVSSALTIDGDVVATFELQAGPRRTLRHEVELAEGAHAIGFGFAGNHTLPLHILELAVEGPIDPNRDALAEPRRACAVAVIDALAPRAFRRPLSEARRDRLVALYDEGADDGDFGAGMRMVFESIVRSPLFGYLILTGSPVADRPGHYELDDYEIASRLSYTLCESPPDDELWVAANAGEVHTPAQIEAQARRYLSLPCGRETVREFYREWLWLTRLDTLARDPEVFPEYTTATREAMRGEAERFVEEVTFSERPIRELFNASYSWINRELAPLYGLDGVGADSDQFVHVELPPERAGVLTTPGLLAVTSKFSQTSPIIRGVFLNRQVLCFDLPNPPQDLDVTPPALDPNATTRERFARHTADESCRQCHQNIDPVGFGFEDFDAIGRHRTTENGLPVDANGGIPAIGIPDGSLTGGAALANAIASSDVLPDCFARQWYRFSLARLEDPVADGPLLAELAAASETSVFEAIVHVTRSYAFRHRVSQPAP